MSPALFTAAVLLASSAQARPWVLTGTSARDLAMAGAGVAGEDAGVAIPVDPAAIASVSGEVAALGLRGSYPSVESTAGDALLDEPIYGLDLAIGAGRSLGDATSIGGGVAMYLPLPEVVATRVHMGQDVPQAPFLEDGLDFAAFDVAVGVGVGPLQLGIGAALGVDLEARTDALLLSLAGEEGEDGFDVTDSVAVENTRTLRWEVAPLVGLHLDTEPVQAFASYRGPSGFDTRGDTELTVVFPLIDPEPTPLEISYLSAWSPGRATAGAALTVGSLRPELAVRYVIAGPFRDTQLGEPSPAFRNVVSPALGAELVRPWTLGPREAQVKARAGYGFAPTPVPPQRGEARFADADRHIIGLGGALELPELPREGNHTELSLSAQLQALGTREGYAATGTLGSLVASVRTGF